MDIRKLKDYCLNSDHPLGKHKVRVFKSIPGLQKKGAELLKELILESLPDAVAQTAFTDKFGTRYTVDIKIRIFNKEGTLTTGWIIKSNEDFPRMITCYLKSWLLTIMNKFKELDTVALLRDLPGKKLSKGQVGTIVDVLDANTYEVEFTNPKGETIKTLPLKEKDLILLHFDTISA